MARDSFGHTTSDRLDPGARGLAHTGRGRAAIVEPARPTPQPGPSDAADRTQGLDVSGSGAFSDFEIVTASASNSGPFDASGDMFIYDLQAGDYTVRIENFGTGDIFVPFPDFSLSFPDEADQGDGIQPIAFTDPDTGDTVTLELAGLTPEQDAGVADLESLTGAFGSGALGDDLIGSGGISGGASGGVSGGGNDGNTVSGNVLADGAPIDTIPDGARELTIGSGGTGRLDVADGGSVNDLIRFTLGAVEGGFGAATLTGAGAAVDMAGAFQSGDAAFMQVGRGGTGALTVENGAALSIDGGTAGFPGFNVGRDAGASGKLKVRGDGSRIEIAGDNDAAGGGSGLIAIGRAGFGATTVENGGAIVNDPAGTTFVGREASATGIVNLRTGGANFDAGEQLLIGADFDVDSGTVQPASGGTGRVRVEDGARLAAGTPNDGDPDVVVGEGDMLSVDAGATLRGDVLNAGGTVDIASGATFRGERLGTDTTAPSVAEATLTVKDDATPGMTVGTVDATDDTGVTSLGVTKGNADLDGDGEPAFALATDGTLTVNDSDDLDAEQRASFALTVEAGDMAGNTGTGTVTVEVMDAREPDTTSPSVPSASFSIKDTAAAGTTVGTVDANDDTGVTSLAITGGDTDRDGDGNTPFTLADDGTLTVNDADDLNGDQPASFTLTVEASDAAGNTGTGTITVDVVKVDTTAPTVEDATFGIKETLEAGATVGTVTASDNLAVTTLAITDGNTDVDGDGNAAFAIADDGTVTVNDADDLDFGAQSSFTLTVEAGDDAGNAGTGRVTVNLSSVLVDTDGADARTGTDSADTLTLVADGTDDTFDAKSDFARDTLDLSGLDPQQLGDAAPTVDLRDGFVETAISGKDTIANFDTVIGTETGDALYGRDSSRGVLAGSARPESPSLANVLEAEQFVDGGGSDVIRLREGQGIASLSPDGTPETEISAGTTRLIDASTAGSFDATTDDVEFDIEVGTYSTTIDGFDSGDVLRFFDGVSITVEPDNDQTDGKQVVTASDNDTGASSTITFTGLTDIQDENLFQRSSFDVVFGDGTLVEGSGSSGGTEVLDNGLDVSRATGGVTVDLTAQRSSATVVEGGGLGSQSGTTVRGFDSVQGSDFDDVLTAPGIVNDGAGADDVTLASGGDGVLYPSADGTAEAAIRAQGEGSLNLIAATGGVTVDLAAQGTDQAVISGGGIGEQPGTNVGGLADVEGSSDADTIVGDSGGNSLSGMRGDDTIDGGAGDDVIRASNGNDMLIGGPGADQFDPLDFGNFSLGVNRIADFDAAEGDVLSLGKFGGIATNDDIAVDLQPGVTLQEPAAAADGFFADAADGGTTPNVVVQDDGTNLTRVFIDGNGDGNYRPDATNDEDAVIELTGTIDTTGISADAITPL